MNSQLREDTKPKEEIIYKFSNNGHSQLREAAIIEGKPYFLKYNQQKGFIQTEPKIIDVSPQLRPPLAKEYPNSNPYEFKTVDQPQVYLQRALKETPDSLLTKIKTVVKKYNDIDDYTLSLFSANIFGSYFQDRFSTVHYLIIVGANGTGKSAFGDTFQCLGYRAVKVTNTTEAFWFRVFGNTEYGQVTIIAEEFDRMDESSQIMTVLKEGYQTTTKVPRMNGNNDRMEFFNPFGFKIIIGEKSPNENKARGVLDRSFKIKSYKGIPDHNIKEIRNPQGNVTRQQLFDEMNDLRKLLFMYRLIHIKDPYREITIGLDGRDEELCKPLLQLFYTLGASQELLNEVGLTLQHFLDIKNKRKGQTLEAVIYPIVLDAVSKHGKVISSTELWGLIIESLDGQMDEKKPGIYHSAEYGQLYRNTVTGMICDKFGAEAEHTRNGYILTFNPEHLSKIAKIYESGTQIKTECEHVNSVNTVNKDVEGSGTLENEDRPSIHAVNDVNVLTKCPYCDYEENGFFLKVHIRFAHPEQANDSI
ncbi:MAG TPA: hypothetical protein VJ772_06505 [Nitrososphaeraceae archaeon]|nr:hypothetical protein [Nitrososphaeraceae archaeon]